MTRQSATARRAEELLGVPVVATAPVAGGDICTATRLKLSDGHSVLMKTLSPRARRASSRPRPAGCAGSPRPRATPYPRCSRSTRTASSCRGSSPASRPPTRPPTFGRALARLHAAGADEFGALPDGFIGRLPLPNGTAPTWGEFFATRRVLPYLKLAQDRGAVTAQQAAAVESLVGRLDDLVPQEPPARLHGDLWNGNVLWGHDGVVRMIDPAAHAGHRETDLAMLGAVRAAAPPARARRLRGGAPRWWTAGRSGVGLHQLFPLLVHAAMFGGGYGARAAALASRY